MNQKQIEIHNLFQYIQKTYPKKLNKLRHKLNMIHLSDTQFLDRMYNKIDDLSILLPIIGYSILKTEFLKFINMPISEINKSAEMMIIEGKIKKILLEF